MSNAFTATHSGKLKLGDAEVACHVLRNGMRVIEVTTIESLLGLPVSALGAFLSSLPDHGGRVEFTRSADTCSMCPAPASHRVKGRVDLLCGKHRAWSDKRGIPTSELLAHKFNRKTFGLPATSVTDMLIAYRSAHGDTEAGQKAGAILRVIIRAGLRTMGQDPAMADVIMAAGKKPL